MSVRKFEDGDRVLISQTPVDNSDRKYSGKVGTVESFAHRNGDQEVYRVMLDGDDYSHAFFDADMLPFGELDALQEELTQAEAKVAGLKEAIKLKERNASDLPIATVVSCKDTFGLSVATKQAEDSWLFVFPTQSGNPNTERLNDNNITQLLASNVNAVIRKP